jgi:hypothetical protein
VNIRVHPWTFFIIIRENLCNSWEEKKNPESCASSPQLSASSKPAKPGSRSLPKAPQANEVCCSKPNNYPHPNKLRSRSQLTTHNCDEVAPLPLAGTAGQPPKKHKLFSGIFVPS